jgi:hypothetical protein
MRGSTGASASGEDPIVPLTTEPNEPLAHLTARMLEDEGIRVLVAPLGAGHGAWGSVATFEHELRVLRSDLDRARAILAEIRAAEPFADGDPDADDS